MGSGEGNFFATRFANNGVTYNELDSGHAFISIIQNGNTSIFGFYPEEGKVNPFTNRSSVSSMGDNASHVYDVNISVNVSSSDLASIISYSINYATNYDLNSYNCTDFAIEVGNIIGLSLPACNGT